MPGIEERDLPQHRVLRAGGAVAVEHADLGAQRAEPPGQVAGIGGDAGPLVERQVVAVEEDAWPDLQPGCSCGGRVAGRSRRHAGEATGRVLLAGYGESQPDVNLNARFQILIYV
jgi:hypothetical protein